VGRGHALYTSEEEKVRLEARNGLLQYDEVMWLIDESGDTLKLTPEIIKQLHYFSIKDIYTFSGRYREWSVKIKGSPHKPPGSRYVPGLVEAMCDMANASTEWDPVRTAAYLLWRLNWIHPFGGGNGRTSRAVSYLALCVRLGSKLPGKLTIPELILGHRKRYEEALRDADTAWAGGVLDVSKMESLLGELLQKQLAFLSGPDQQDSPQPPT
jgi:Fic family protein